MPDLDSVSSALAILDDQLRKLDNLRKRLAAGDAQGVELALRQFQPWSLPAIVYTAVAALRQSDAEQSAID